MRERDLSVMHYSSIGHRAREGSCYLKAGLCKLRSRLAECSENACKNAERVVKRVVGSNIRVSFENYIALQSIVANLQRQSR